MFRTECYKQPQNKTQFIHNKLQCGDVIITVDERTCCDFAYSYKVVIGINGNLLFTYNIHEREITPIPRLLMDLNIKLAKTAIDKTIAATPALTRHTLINPESRAYVIQHL